MDSMSTDRKPKFGLLQPTTGPSPDIGFCAMVAGQPKSPKYVAHRERRLLTLNVKMRMEQRYKGKRNKILAFSEESGVGRSTIQRIVDPETYGSYGPTIDTMALMAKALRC